jgi:hypothetical protein
MDVALRLTDYNAMLQRHLSANCDIISSIDNIGQFTIHLLGGNRSSREKFMLSWIIPQMSACQYPEVSDNRSLRMDFSAGAPRPALSLSFNEEDIGRSRHGSASVIDMQIRLTTN